MINKISSNIARSGTSTLVTKSFQRNLQQIDTKSGYIGNRLYYREWIVKGYNKAVKYFQSYNSKGIPFKNSSQKIDLTA